MGVPKFLSHVLESAGRLIDLRAYAEQEKPLRIAVDISTWIFKACQAYSDMLADEKHLSNYGRATLLFQQEQAATATAAGAGAANNSEVITANHPSTTTYPQNQGKDVQEFIAKSCTTVIERLIAMQVDTNANLLVVLDGATPPIKQNTVGDRRQKRHENQEQRDLPVDLTGNSPALERRIKANRRTGAGEHYSAVVEAILAELRNHKIPFLVAPYEADGELAFLSYAGYIDLVITEDSDLVAYGLAKPVLYRLTFNPDNVLTRGILVRQSDMAATVPGAPNKFDFTEFSPAMYACLFAATGCDYCEKLRGIGVAGACNDVRTAFLTKSCSNTSPLESLFRLLFGHTWDRNTMTGEAKDKYIRNFLGALLMYRHAVVFDPVQGRCRSLNARPDPELMLFEPYAELFRDDVRRAAIVGTMIPAPIAIGIAEGNICPKRMKVRKGVENFPEHLLTILEEYRATLRKREQVEDDEEDLGTQREVLVTVGVSEARSQAVAQERTVPNGASEQANVNQTEMPRRDRTDESPYMTPQKRFAENEATASTVTRRAATQLEGDDEEEMETQEEVFTSNAINEQAMQQKNNDPQFFQEVEVDDTIHKQAKVREPAETEEAPTNPSDADNDEEEEEMETQQRALETNVVSQAYIFASKERMDQAQPKQEDDRALHLPAKNRSAADKLSHSDARPPPADNEIIDLLSSDESEVM